ncbi:MAG: ABC transporter substrate-binding protein, partial [Anaerolineales bacterium]|nr:ABC transporter substrate-binding protein [Anaerolineales bacterium]
FESLGGLVLYADQIDAGQSDVTSALATTAAVQPDVVYLGLFEPEALVLVTQLRENDALADAVLLGSDALLLDSFARSAGAAINNMYLSAPTAAGSGYDAFLQAWALRNEGSPQRAYGAFAYDATSILLNALVDAAQLSGDESMLIGRTRLRAAVAMTNTESRVTGALACTAVGECAGQATLGVFRLQDRELPNSSWPPQRVWLPEED